MSQRFPVQRSEKKVYLKQQKLMSTTHTQVKDYISSPEVAFCQTLLLYVRHQKFSNKKKRENFTNYSERLMHISHFTNFVLS